MGEGLRGRGRYVWPKARHRCAQSRIERLLGGSVLGHGGGGADTTRAVMAEVAATRQKFYQQGGFMQGADVMTWADSVPGQERHDGAEDAAQLLSERNRHDALTLAGVRAGQLRREEQAAGKSVAAVDTIREYVAHK